MVGASWTALYLARGLDVVASDPRPGAEAKLRRYVDTAWQALKIIGVSPKGSPEHLRFTPDPLRAVAEAEFVQECAPEDSALKANLFSQLDAGTPIESIIASSTGTLSISAIQAKCAHPERCIVAHPFNPPHIVPLVEVVGGTKTSADTIQRTMSFYAAIGRKPIHVRKEILGHVGNRLQAAMYREIAHLIAQEVVSVADADAAVCWGPGLRWGVMGPSLLFHLGAGEGGMHHFMQHLAQPIGACWDDLGHPVLTPELQQIIIRGVMEEVGGRSREALARDRDQLIVGLLRLRSKLVRAAKVSRRGKRGVRAGRR